MGATTYLYASVRAPDAQWVPLTGGHVASALLVAALRNSRYSFHFSLGPSFVVESNPLDLTETPEQHIKILVYLCVW